MAQPLQISYVELQNVKDIESMHLELNGQKYPISRDRNQKRTTYSRVFDPPLTLDSALYFSTIPKKSLFTRTRKSDLEIITFAPDHIRTRLNGLEFQRVWEKILIKINFLPQTRPDVTPPSAGPSLPAKPEGPQPTTEQSNITHSRVAHDTARSAGITAPANIPAPSNREGLRPTTEELIEQCPRFRVLVVGKSGVGKSSLINQIFGVETASVARDRPGQADIEQEFTSPENDRLILHDSKGFEPADGGNYETVKSFIEKRKSIPDIKDQLHAVWLCFQIPIPTYGERLLEDGAETFLKLRKDVLGNTPTIVVFTKHDRLVTFTRQKKRGDPESEKQYLREFCIEPIQQFTGDEAIAHIAVSSKPKYERSLEGLIRLTQEKVSESFTSSGNQVSAVPLAAAGAQRMLPTLKVDLSIDVGKQKYWRALGTSANFPGYTMQDCLRVIHIDIVTVWNYYDPCRYLYSDEFLRMMMNMVETVDAPPGSTHQLSRSDSLAGGGVPLIALAPIMLPLKAFAALGEWAYETYQRLQGFHTKFMAYIVDLTHVLEILFSLAASIRAKKLTRRAIKLAYNAYHGSEWMRLTHTDIKSFQCWSTARDAVLDKITSMISSDDREVRVSRAIEGVRGGMPVDLEEDEEWVVQAVSL